MAGHYCFDETTEADLAMHRRTSRSTTGRSDSKPADHRQWRVRYGILTLALFVPLLSSFVFIRNLYPFAASTMMMAAVDPSGGQNYYILRGETLTGSTIDLPAVDLTNALSNVAFGLVSATVENKSFSIRWLHPANADLLNKVGGAANLPSGARLPDLLRSWGEIYNSRLPASSPQRLRAVRIDAYRWEPGAYSKFDTYIKTWRVEL